MLAIDAFSHFIRYAQLRTEPLVSVVLPTYNRPDRLRRAIDSVLSQRYQRWELLVVDDGGETDSKALTEETGDGRIRWMRVDHQGACGARNAALGGASGEIIAYLDDDNAMDPEWLYSVVWAFDERPEIDVLYGAFVIDDVLRIDGKSSGELPRTILHPWNRETLRRGNLADMGAIAHRNGLPQGRFDAGLVKLGDWDLLLRLTIDRDPLVLPAIACYYMTDAPDRLTLATQPADYAAVAARAAFADAALAVPEFGPVSEAASDGEVARNA
jgi:glycosyltransferase involved in cell wall biosynthesis